MDICGNFTIPSSIDWMEPIEAFEYMESAGMVTITALKDKNHKGGRYSIEVPSSAGDRPQWMGVFWLRKSDHRYTFDSLCRKICRRKRYPYVYLMSTLESVP